MREMKFRAWDGKKFYNPIIYNGQIYRDYRDFEDGIDHTDPVMQYTGHDDRNGKPIYEGDILQYDNERYEVYWSEDWAMFAVRGCQNPALIRYSQYGEVIANRYEHPELLEG